jgi:hypothetical protein
MILLVTENDLEFTFVKTNFHEVAQLLPASTQEIDNPVYDTERPREIVPQRPSTRQRVLENEPQIAKALYFPSVRTVGELLPPIRQSRPLCTVLPR